jgi:hypothetical protein
MLGAWAQAATLACLEAVPGDHPLRARISSPDFKLRPVSLELRVPDGRWVLGSCRATAHPVAYRGRAYFCIAFVSPEAGYGLSFALTDGLATAGATIRRWGTQGAGPTVALSCRRQDPESAP